MFPLRCAVRRLSSSWINLKKDCAILRCQVVKINTLNYSFYSNQFIYHNQKIRVSTMNSGENIPSKDELVKKLTPLQYHVTQEKGTERPFTGEYDKSFNEGTYSCIVCGQYLFSSNTKYDSGCGWPAFNNVLDKGRIKLLPDTSGGRIRTEVQCSKCSAHLGHVFDDGPKPTGKRYCINSASINFLPAEDKKST